MVKVMNKHLIVSGIVVLLICVGLSGCTENNSGEINTVVSEPDKVEVKYDFYTRWTTTEGFWNDRVVWHEHLGFYDPPGEDVAYYTVRGTVKNIYDKPLSSVSFSLKLYDSQGNLLGSSSNGVSNLYMGDEKEFQVSIHFSSIKYIEHVSDYTFTWSARVQKFK